MIFQIIIYVLVPVKSVRISYNFNKIPVVKKIYDNNTHIYFSRVTYKNKTLSQYIKSACEKASEGICAL